MKKTKFYINWQIDCEATQHSIQDPELGRRSDQGLFEILEEHGFKGNFMVIPGDMVANADLYRMFHEHGHEIGLQIHPGDEGFFEFAGVMSPDEQREMIAHCKKKWSDAIGFVPKALSIGYCSTNDFTFGIAEEFGFTHGILTFPERTIAEMACTFPGAPRDVHFANRYNRILPGDMDFVNIPLTIDPDSRMWGGKHPQDLRVELVDAKNHWYTIYKDVKRQKDDDTIPIKMIRGVTHNIFEYSDPKDFRRQTMLGMIEAMKDILEQNDCELYPATFKMIADDFRKIAPKIDIKELLKLDRRAYRGKKVV